MDVNTAQKNLDRARNAQAIADAALNKAIRRAKMPADADPGVERALQAVEAARKAVTQAHRDLDNAIQNKP